MRSIASLAALAASISSVSAAFQGFNYGSTFTTGAAKQQSDFEAEFKASQGLPGTNGAFNSARLYTMVQAGTPNSPISAIPAAISTKTSLLLGLWASAGDQAFSQEIVALKTAISTYGAQLAPLVAGISVGSEDLYRITPTGIQNGENPGAGPDVLANYIKQVRDVIANTPLSGAKIGHVDTWTAWVNASNKAVTDACDWVGVDAYPYFQDTQANSIDNNKGLFLDAFRATQAAAGGKEVWVTETGFPVSGKSFGQAVPSVDNAKRYWQEVGCGSLFGQVNTWWFTMQDAAPQTPNPSFGIIGSDLNSQPYYDLSCEGLAAGPSSSNPPGAPATSSDTPSPPPSTTSSTGSPGGRDGSGSAPVSGTPTNEPTPIDGSPSTQVPPTSLVTTAAGNPTASGTTSASMPFVTSSTPGAANGLDRVTAGPLAAALVVALVAGLLL